MIPFDRLWEQYKRIIKPNGAIALFGSQPFTSALVMSNPKWFKYEWIWDKVSGGSIFNARLKPMQTHENICIFSEGKTSNGNSNNMNYFPVMQFAEPKNIRPANTKGSKMGKSVYDDRAKQRNAISSAAYDNTVRYPKSIFKISKYTGDSNSLKRNHPTQKPVALIEYLIKTYTLEGDLILDNTAGSGTLAIAAINTNRQYICIEKDEHYFEVMRDRVANHDPNAPIKTKKPPRIPKGQLTLF